MTDLSKEKQGKPVRKSFWFCEGCSYDRGKCVVFSRHKPDRCCFNINNEEKEKYGYGDYCWFKQSWGEGLRSIAATLDVQECIQPDYYEPEPKRPSPDWNLM